MGRDDECAQRTESVIQMKFEGACSVHHGKSRKFILIWMRAKIKQVEITFVKYENKI